MKTYKSTHKTHSQSSAESQSSESATQQSLFPPALAVTASPIQREENGVIDMPESNITVYRGNSVEQSIGGLDSMRGQGIEQDGMEMNDPSRQGRIDANSPNPTQRLPFSEGGGWDAEAILTNLGQYDRIGGTDSDGVRCVQAVAMASFIPGGPDSVKNYLSGMAFDSMLSRPMNQRTITARRVMEYVEQKLENRTATYADLSWAQEAVHDLYYDDATGTDVDQIPAQLDPMLDTSRDIESIDAWCSNPAELISQMNGLQAGEQLIITKMQVLFNETFVDFEVRNLEEGANIDIQDRMRVETEEGRRAWIRRIDASERPNPSQIDENRDKKSGHQLLLMKGNQADSPVNLYEPELTRSGQHLSTISGPSDLEELFTEHPEAELYNYVLVIGKIKPSGLSLESFGDVNP